MLSVQVSDRDREPSVAKPKKRAKKSKQVEDEGSDDEQSLRFPPSTNVSSPAHAQIQNKRKKGKSLATVVDTDEEEEMIRQEMEEQNLSVHANGYIKDGFVMSDDDDDDDDGFEPLPKTHKRDNAPRNVGPRIEQDRRLGDLDDLHRDVVLSFVQEAKQLEESLRNAQSLRKPLFSEKSFREMAIRWTTTLPEMRKIPGIEPEKVSKFGSKFIPLIKRYQGDYNAMTGMADDIDEMDVGVVDLISSDEDEEMAGDDDDDDEEESSKYFDSGRPPPLAPDVEAWNARMKELDTPDTTRASSSTSSRGRGGGRGGRKTGFRRTSGGAAYKKAGVTKKRASAGPSRKSSGGASASGSRNSAVTNYFSKNGKRGGGGGGRSGGGSSGGGIAMMPI